MVSPDFMALRNSGFGGAQFGGIHGVVAELLLGQLVFGVTDYAAKLTTLHYGAIAAREPRSDEIRAACRKLGPDGRPNTLTPDFLDPCLGSL